MIDKVNVIVAVGSVDGMAAATACMRHLGNPDIQLVFTQAFQVDQIDPAQWQANSQVGFIDLAVNSQNPEMTEVFVKRICELGHTILFIADEHGKSAWQKVFTNCGLDSNKLSIHPEDRTSECWSSSAILKRALGKSADPYTAELLDAGDQGDRMNFETHLGAILNRAVKSNPGDPARRLYLVRHLAQQRDPDEAIRRWMDEYAEMERNLPKILQSRQDLGKGVSLYDCTIGPHDATTLFTEAYKLSSIAILRGPSQLCIATNRKELDLRKIIPGAGGTPFRVNCPLAGEQAAIDALRALP